MKTYVVKEKGAEKKLCGGTGAWAADLENLSCLSEGEFLFYPSWAWLVHAEDGAKVFGVLHLLAA